MGLKWAIKIRVMLPGDLRYIERTFLVQSNDSARAVRIAYREAKKQHREGMSFELVNAQEVKE